MTTNSLTVVVTNFGRPELLDRCLKSVIDAGVSRIVCSSMKPDEAVRAVWAKYKDAPGIEFFVTSIDGDLGCNELWLRGLYQAETPYVLILHDDDFLDPKFGEVYASIIEPQLDAGCGFASWRGTISHEDGRTSSLRYIEGPTQVCSTYKVMSVAAQRGKPPLSPVISVFRKKTAIAALKECRQNFMDKQCYSRPGMMLGNEILIYLRHAEQYSSWVYVDEALTYFGAHPGSETVSALANNRWGTLIAGYDWARDYYFKTRAATIKLEPSILHVWSDFDATDPEEARRNDEARRTWQTQFELGEAIPVWVKDEHLSRNSGTSLGDPRPVPFIRDLLDHGCSMAQEEDLVVLTNRDICVTINGLDKIKAKFREPNMEAAFGWRRVFKPNAGQNYRTVAFAPQDGGVDLIVVRPGWWRRYREYMPDMLIGREAWDWVLRVLIAEAHMFQPGGIQLDDLIYHEPHEGYWIQGERRVENPGQKHNMKLARTFFFTRGRREGGYFDKMKD